MPLVAQARRRRRWILLAGVTLLGGALACLGLSCSSSKPSGPGTVQTVPPQGLVMSEYSGTKTPMPIAFCPNGKIYGMQRVTRNGQSALMALEGTYDDPQTVASYYQRFYQDTTNAQSLRVEYSSPSWGSATSAFRLWKARADSASGYMIISVWASSEGFSRDIAKWLPDAPPNAAAGGDPKETMVWLLVRWK